MIFRNQRGITLLELLAAIVIVGFLTILIWRIFFQTIDQNSYVITEQTLQQEANVILSTIQSLHTKDTVKKIYIESNVLYADTMKANKIKISDRTGFTYHLYSSPPILVNGIPSGTLASGAKIDYITSMPGRIILPLYLSLSAEFKDGKKTHFILNTTLSKLSAE